MDILFLSLYALLSLLVSCMPSFDSAVLYIEEADEEEEFFLVSCVSSLLILLGKGRYGWIEAWGLDGDHTYFTRTR